MTEQGLIHKIEWVNKRCSLKGEPLTQRQIELLMFVFADTVVNKNLDLAVSGSATPVRLQRSRKHKQISPNGLPIVYVGRPTKWGNPFKVTGEDGHWFVMSDDGFPLVTFEDKKDAIACCVENYKEYISHEHNLGIKNIADLIGKNLSCWCAMDCLCHADILLELATKVERYYR